MTASAVTRLVPRKLVILNATNGCQGAPQVSSVENEMKRLRVPGRN
jgi:hypothetical protein